MVRKTVMSEDSCFNRDCHGDIKKITVKKRATSDFEKYFLVRTKKATRLITLKIIINKFISSSINLLKVAGIRYNLLNSILAQMKKLILLTLIIVLAFSLRFYQLGSDPPSLNWDEVSHGYNAYSLLRTGSDEWGNAWPTIFRAYGDYKLPVYIYLTVITEKFIGLNALAVRLPSALAGTISVLLVFLLVRKLFKNDNLGLLTALLLAVEPWGLFLSRIAVEANVAILFIITGLYFFLKGLEKGRWMLLSALFWGLSLHTYNSARIFVPLFLAVLVIIYRFQLLSIIKKATITMIMSFLVFICFVGIMGSQVLSGEGQARYRWVNLLDEGAVNQIISLRTRSSWSPPFPRLIYNKISFFIYKSAGNYLSYFSPKFLFFKGGDNNQFNLPNFGLIYPFQLFFILLGLASLCRKQNLSAKVIISWLLISPIAGSLTKDSPHALRAIVMLPLPQILTVLGLEMAVNHKLLEKISKGDKLKILFCGLYFCFLAIFFLSYWNKYFTTYRTNYSWSWQYGYAEAVVYVKNNYADYDKIVFTKKYGEPHEFVLFYWPWDPAKMKNDTNLVRYFKSDWYWVDGFDNFIFVNDWEMVDKLKIKNKQSLMLRNEKSKILVVTSPGNYPEEWKLLKTINFLDGKPAFDILNK